MPEETVVTGEPQDMVIITVGGEDIFLDQERLEVDMDTPSDVILEKCQSMISENLSDDDDEVSFMVQKTTTNRNIHVFPKTPAGLTD
tara:strand:+ start:231 stop:491 length:261 start_codon:yes stop_codon:yes gene_type:complete